MEKSKALNVFPIIITIRGKDELIEGELVRTKAPRTVERILEKLPLTGRVMIRENQLTLSVNIKRGKEKSGTKASKGDIGYWPMSDALCIFLDETEPYGGITIIGEITSNLDALMNLRLGSTLKITQK